MTADVDNLVLEHLRLLRSDIKEMRTEMQSGFHDLKDRMARLETAMLRVKRDALGAEESVPSDRLHRPDGLSARHRSRLETSREPQTKNPGYGVRNRGLFRV